MPTGTRPEALDVEAIRVSQAAGMRDRAVARVVREDRPVRLANPVDVAVPAADRVVDLLRPRQV